MMKERDKLHKRTVFTGTNFNDRSIISDLQSLKIDLRVQFNFHTKQINFQALEVKL